ncbi:MAG TPA: phosphoribosyl-AMP cyclohydrolase [Syntrophomonas sp.]|nr:phosphoribosyl-AMP cyclohydrolase [Syntrophomonas sp.]
MMKDDIKFDAHGLVPAIIQDARSGQVLMLAYMDAAALDKTLANGQTWFYSRSREQLWMKGESSGHVQQVKEILYDCDGDTLLIKVEQTGAACHTGHYSCFYRDRDGREVEPQVFDPATVYGSQGTVPPLPPDSHDREQDGAATANRAAISTQAAAQNQGAELRGLNPATAATPAGGCGHEGGAQACNSEMTGAKADSAILFELYDVIKERQAQLPEGSYTTYLFTKGIDKILKKVGEENAEVIIAAKNRSRSELVYETSDLLYHLLVLLVEQDVTLDEIFAELASRRK